MPDIRDAYDLEHIFKSFKKYFAIAGMEKIINIIVIKDKIRELTNMLLKLIKFQTYYILIIYEKEYCFSMSTIPS